MQNSFQSQTEPLQNHHFPTLAMLDPNLHFNTQWLTHPIAKSHDGILVQLVPLFIPHLLQIEHALHFFRLNFQAVLLDTFLWFFSHRLLSLPNCRFLSPSTHLTKATIFLTACCFLFRSRFVTHCHTKLLFQSSSISLNSSH